MTSKNLFIVFSLALGIFAIWYFFGQSDEKKIKKIIEQIESAFTEPVSRDLPAIVRRINTLGQHLTPTVHISLSSPRHNRKIEITSQSEAKSLAMQFLQLGYKVEKPFREIKSLIFNSSSTAVIQLDIQVSQTEVLNFPVEIHFKKENRTWLIERVKTSL